MDFVAQQRFTSLRQQLDSLHYCQPFNIESAALVERLLNEVLQTTEAFQKVKNDNAVIANEATLNGQSMAPLQHENERIVKENNDLHFQLIQYREHADGADLKWKAQCRQTQNEVQDLKFLLAQKDSQIATFDSDSVKLRQKLDRVMEKLYMPSQDQIIGGLNSDGKLHNVLRGATQGFQLSQNLAGEGAGNQDFNEGEGDESMEQSERIAGGNQRGMTIKDQEWASELRRADERANELRHKYDELVQQHLQQDEKARGLNDQIEIRDNEIMRLSKLYQGGQNMDQLAQKYQHETNEKTMQKLQNQVAFLNKENHRIQVLLDITNGDRAAVDQMDLLRQEIDELTQENGQLRSDLRELTTTLKDFQEIEFRRKQQDMLSREREAFQQEEINQRLRELDLEKVRTQEERERAESLRAAFNADKQALQNRVHDLEGTLKENDGQKQDVTRRVALMEQNDSQQRNELNFWNGKVNNMKRDLDFSQDFNTKLTDENQNLRTDVECLKTHLEMRDKEHGLLNRQIRGLQEDNERIAKMYQLVQNFSSGKPVNDEEVAAPCNAWEQAKLKDKAEQQTKKGWNVASEDMRGSPVSLANTHQFNRRQDNAVNDQRLESQFDQKITVKRNNQ